MTHRNSQRRLAEPLYRSPQYQYIFQDETNKVDFCSSGEWVQSLLNIFFGQSFERLFLKMESFSNFFGVEINSGSLKCSPPLTVAISQAQPLQPWEFGVSPHPAPTESLSASTSLLWAPCTYSSQHRYRLALTSRKGHRSGPLI